MSRRRPLALGIDGCRAGWIVAASPDEATAPTFRLARTFEEIARELQVGGAVACVDVPIGLCDGRRRCDGLARARLGARRSPSVFTPPCRGALAGGAPAEIRALNAAATGRSLSAQTLGIVPKIREVDRVVTPALQARLREVHPELAFAALAGGAGGLALSKKTAAGRLARVRLLPPALARAAPDRRSRPFAAGEAALDDYLDALAALSVALRLARGVVTRLPSDGEERDDRGLVMEILY